MDTQIFEGCIPALMTPCDADGKPNFEALVQKGKTLVDQGMSAVVYCGSMGDWPLLSDSQRMEGVKLLVEAGVPVVVGTGAVSTTQSVAHAQHAQDVGAAGLMVIPRLLSRSTSASAQVQHFKSVLNAAPELPAVIYNSPYYGYQTKADVFFEIRSTCQNLIGFKEFGGADALSYAAEFITNQSDDLLLMVGVDTQVYHGFTRCNASGAITGIGNCLPVEILRFLELSKRAQKGCATSRRLASEFADAIQVLSTFDEGPDLVLYYKYLLELLGEHEYAHHFNDSDQLSPSQARFAESQLHQFQSWWQDWSGKSDDVSG